MAYAPKTIIEGLRDTFMADPDGSAIGVNFRCKLVADAATPDSTPVLQLASATERGSVWTCQPIAAGVYGCCQYLHGGGGTHMGICVGTIVHGADVYAAADGKVSAASGGGALKLGVCILAGADGGTCTWHPNAAAA